MRKQRTEYNYLPSYLRDEYEKEFGLPRQVAEDLAEYQVSVVKNDTCPVCGLIIDDCECGWCQSHLGRGGELDE